MFSELPGGSIGRRAASAAVDVAKAQIGLLKEVPAIVRQLAEIISGARTDAGTRLTTAAQLAYLVQPHDIIDDGLPGGFGYIDDAIFLRLALGSQDTNPLAIPFHGMCVPRDVVSAMRKQMAEMQWLTNYMRLMPPFTIDSASRQILENPFVKLVPPGAVPDSAVARAPNLHDGVIADETVMSVTYLFEGGGGVRLKDGVLSSVD